MPSFVPKIHNVYWIDPLEQDERDTRSLRGVVQDVVDEGDRDGDCAGEVLVGNGEAPAREDGGLPAGLFKINWSWWKRSWSFNWTWSFHQDQRNGDLEQPCLPVGEGVAQVEGPRLGQLMISLSAEVEIKITSPPLIFMKELLHERKNGTTNRKVLRGPVCGGDCTI